MSMFRKLRTKIAARDDRILDALIMVK